MSRSLIPLLTFGLALVPLHAVAVDGNAPIPSGGGGGSAPMSAGPMSAGPMSAGPIGAEPTGTTYYEDVLSSAPAEELFAPSSGVPDGLAFSDSFATVEYLDSAGADQTTWTVRVRGLYRRHERVDAVYHMIAVLPLPVAADGGGAFSALSWGIRPQEGSETAAVHMVYGGEKVVLKRNFALEKTLLPNLVGPSWDQLPSLDDTSYGYTMWDTILLYDPKYGDTVQGFADFSYTTDAGVAAPDASDGRFKAYLITWIPELDPTVPPFTVRMDVIESR